MVAIESGLKLRRAQHRPTPVIAYEAPDEAISARFTLRAGMVGYVRTTTLKAFPEAAYREIIAHLGR